jgi:hypothetical protein
MLFPLLVTVSSGQENKLKKSKIFITGAVYDSETKEPLTNARFTIHKLENYSTLSNGKFSLFGNPGDTISYKYLGYKDMRVIIPDTLKELEYLMGVFMPKDTILMPEVVIFPRIDDYPSIVNEVRVNEQMINQAQRNVNKATIQGLTQSATNYDAEMNAKKTMRGYEMKAQNKGLLANPENSVGFSTSNYKTHYLQFGSPMVRSKKLSNALVSQNEIALILATHDIMRADTTKASVSKP